MTDSLHRMEPGQLRAQERSQGSGLGALFALILAAMAVMIAVGTIADLGAIVRAPALNAERAAPSPGPDRIHADRH